MHTRMLPNNGYAQAPRNFLSDGAILSLRNILPWSDVRTASMRFAIEPRTALYEASACTNLGG